MSGGPPDDRGANIALALLRVALIAFIFTSEQLVDARQLADWQFFIVLGLAALYASAGLALASGRFAAAGADALKRVEPTFDVFLLVGLAYTSGGAFSDVRKAFFVIPMVAAFSERPSSTAKWSLLAVLAFSGQAIIAGGHPPGTLNSWQRLTLSQDMYLAWTGAAATLLAFKLRRRSAHTREIAESRQRLVTQAIESVERERTRLAGALHDAPVQNLIAARHDLRRAERFGDRESFQRLHAALDLTIAELREEIFKLHPHVLDHVGLRAAVEQVARRYADGSELRIAVDVESEDMPHREVLFALARELMSNAAKHARASQVRVAVARIRDGVELVVQDDGCGIADARMRQALLDGHIGLAAVSERVQALGGRLTISSSPATGTAIHITLPIEPRERNGTPALGLRADVSDRGTRHVLLGTSSKAS
jgi:two-component system NarL family sensor kinase